MNINERSHKIDSFVLNGVILETDHILNSSIFNFNKVRPEQDLIPLHNSLQHFSIVWVRYWNQMHAKILIIEFGRILQFYEFISFKVFLLDV